MISSIMATINSKIWKAGAFASLALVSATVLAEQAPTLSLTPLNAQAQSRAGDVATRIEARERGQARQRSQVAARSFAVDFVPGSQAVAGINFDVVSDRGELRVVACGSTVGNTHIAQCKRIAPNRVRVLIFSAPVERLQAVEALEFELLGSDADARIEQESVAVSDLSGNVIQADVI